MLISTTVLDWRGKGRRVSNRTSGDAYLLNTNRMFEILDHTQGSCMTFFDDLVCPYEGGEYLVSSSTVSQIKTASDVLPVSDIVQLVCFRDGNVNKATETINVKIDDIAYAKAYLNGTYTRAVLSREGAGIYTVILDMTMAELEALVIPVPVVDTWTDAIYILKSGAIWYKRERNSTLGYFKLWYSSDSGVNYEELMSLDLTEESVIIDTAHAYTHQIVGTAYQVVFNGEILYTT